MPRKYSLSDKKTIEQCAKYGEKKYTNFFIIKKLKSDSPKFAIVVSKKVSGKATVRNKLKRQVKAILSKNIKSVNNYNYLIVLKNEAGDATYADIKEDLEKYFN